MNVTEAIQHFTCTKCLLAKPCDCFNKEKRVSRGYNSVCKECNNAYMREYKKEYRKTEKYKLDHKKYQTSEHYREWQREHKKKPTQREYERNYRKTHKMSVESRVNMNIYRKKRYDTNPCVRVYASMAGCMGDSIRKQKSGRKWESLVGYTLRDLMSHLEKQFDNNMSWDNYGKYWHIDHIVPKSYFNINSFEDPNLELCWGLSNLQPLEAIENLRKGNKINYNIRGGQTV